MKFDIDPSLDSLIKEKEKSLRALKEETQQINESMNREWTKFALVVRQLKPYVGSCDYFEGYSKEEFSMEPHFMGWSIFKDDLITVLADIDDIYIYKNIKKPIKKLFRTSFSITHKLAVHMSLDILKRIVLRTEIKDPSILPLLPCVYQAMCQKRIELMDKETLDTSCENEFKKLVAF